MEERSTAEVVRQAVERATGGEVAGITVVRGGDTSAAYRVELGDGRTFFAKTHPSPPSGFFTTEASSLRWLAESGAVRVPDVIDASDGDDAWPGGHLVLSWIDEGPGRPDEADLGRRLARLHASGAPSFGRDDGRTTGSLGLPNHPCETWAEFVATCRFEPLAAIALERSSLPVDVIEDLDRLASTLESFDDGAPPARLHGDLWAGNRLVDADGDSWLIDPAAHGGHREFDLAMMLLFGGFGTAAFDAYSDGAPLADDWQERIELHQIAPLVVHAIKFGGSYVAAATRAIRRYL